METYVELLSAGINYIKDASEENKELFLKQLEGTNSSVTMAYVLTTISKKLDDFTNVDACTFVISSIDKKMKTYKPVNSVYDEEERRFKTI